MKIRHEKFEPKKYSQPSNIELPVSHETHTHTDDE